MPVYVDLYTPLRRMFRRNVQLARYHVVMSWRQAKARKGWLAVGALGASMLFPVQRQDFFDGRFTTAKDPADVMEFYSAEDLLKVLAVHPLFVKAGLSGVEFMDTPPDGWDAATWSPHTGMEVSFRLDEEEDTAGEVAYFQRHERFINYLPGLAYFGLKVLLWDQTWNFGYRKKDGVCEVYHHGESFAGPWPVVALVELHQRYVLWACSKHVNSKAFGTDDIEVVDEQASHIPQHVFSQFLQALHRDLGDVLSTASADSVVELSESLEHLASMKESAAAESATMKETTAIDSDSGRVLSTQLALQVGDKHAEGVVQAALAQLDAGHTGAAKAALATLLGHPDIARASSRWRVGKDGGKTAYFARLPPAERLAVLAAAGVNTSGLTGRRGEGKVALFAALEDTVKAEALRAAPSTTASC
eukprot:TRINITY_DN27334_c0_g1_i1.p1 TRINITY_DN27334_c0_g1~~TRINITY_DN27334_c0_g1_i1.p1  ORF type:complete len:443 (+),score=180.79 TRINITY_DN27334_c0_g1_i1:77-1330(+)